MSSKDSMSLEDMLLLDNQLCFPLYAAAKEVVRRYTPFLAPFDLTYTQYIAMMVLWEKKTVSVNELGKQLMLDSGTLTPLLRKLEDKKYLLRKKSKTVSPLPIPMALKKLAVLFICFANSPNENILSSVSSHHTRASFSGYSLAILSIMS